MLYLIGGAPRCGKTTFSKKLAAQKRISWISTDLLRATIRPYFSSEEQARLLPQAPHGSSPQEHLDAEKCEANTLWQGITRFLGGVVRWHHDYVVEGVHLFPHLLAQLKDIPEFQYLPDFQGIKILYFVKTDLDAIYHGLKQSDPHTDWMMHAAKTDEDVWRGARTVHTKSLYLKEEAEKYGFPVVDTGADFHGIIEHLLKAEERGS